MTKKFKFIQKIQKILYRTYFAHKTTIKGKKGTEKGGRNKN
jgi:hypothetical protein